MEQELAASVLARFDLFLLLFLRALGLLTTAPVWSGKSLPVQVRVALALAVALLLLPLLPPPLTDASLISLIPLAARELLVGMLIGFVAALVMGAIQFAGQLLDMGMGLSMVNVLDPLSNTQVPVVGSFLHLLAMLIFLTVGGHHMLLHALVESYAILPPGSAVAGEPVHRWLVEAAAGLFVTGLKVAAPVLAALFLSMAALGMLNRAVPQINVFIVGLPVQLAVGSFMLLVGLPLYVAFLRVLFGGMNSELHQLLRLMAAW